MNDDMVFINQYLSGNAEAGGELVMIYQKQIYAFLYRMTGDAEESKDLTQGVFVSALKGLPGFRKDASFKTWLYKIAMNAGLNHLAKRREETEIDESTPAQADRADCLIEKEKREIIKKEISGLPERQRMAITLRAYQGLSISEAALVMGCTEGAVKAHYSLAVKKLKDSVTAKGYDNHA
ncbi:MAG: RNA polymerase sigma factor [Nitrospiraceae bacterium]|nr:RNA polymerase sigma factor [Nitrospiraceae bacterium]